MTTPTRDELERLCHWRNTAHYNMGRSVGYGYGFTCDEHPRISYIDRFYKPTREHPDGRSTRTWYVDGAEVKGSLDDAVELLATPPALTDDERRVLEMVPAEFADLRDLEDQVAGVQKPEGAIKPDTPHSRALRLLSALCAKGMIEYQHPPSQPGDHLPARGDEERWSPKVRRRPGT